MRTVVVMVLLGAGCGAAPAGAPERGSPVAERPATEAPPDSSAAPSATAPAPAPAPRPPRLARDSDPDGIDPLSGAEQREVQEACGPVMDAAKRAARADKHQKPSADYVEALADAPPKIAGVDVPRCIALLLRELRAYQARSKESAAMNDLKRILVGLSGAVAQGERCPSAPPVPEDLAALEVGPVIPPIDRYAAAGWRCVRFDTQGAPQHFQYEVRRDGDRYELIARGFPVRGGPAVELFIETAVVDGHVPLTSDVYRR